ncbi:pentapeptide repeat-containing protein [Actinosynnema sp. NPDC050436]|uniref:pentapeptide repeat-containing protein n=1 Tax=Actinosynnema sp. NPDC050436 TaxID=3155659 RepID=UPI0033C570E3
MGEQQDRPSYKVLSTRTIVWFGVVLVVVGAGVAAALLWAYGAGTEADKARLDAIKTAGTIVVGTGGAAALWLAARRQQAAEITLRQKDVDQAHQEQDAAERRVTELYTKAVEQLGSEKAAVRLGGMYALERLAQNVPDQRQIIVNVLCSYLRMPFQSPVAPDLVSTVSTAANTLIVPEQVAGEQAGSTVDRVENERRIQEREVRLTAQRDITKHLHPRNDTDHPAETLWENIDLDLTGATLVALDLENCRVRTAQFGGVTFEGYAVFDGVTFEGYAAFDGVTFEGEAGFGGVTFEGEAVFDSATFKRYAGFGGATFGNAGFGGATFEEYAGFGGARVRLDVVPKPLRSWPDGFSVTDPGSLQEAALKGLDGMWGYLVSVRDGSQLGEGDE